jgi:endonuclease III-like uncharacterized protein
MKRSKEVKAFFQGYELGKRETIEKILKFVDDECEFIIDIHCDSLLDRLVKIIKKL